MIFKNAFNVGLVRFFSSSFPINPVVLCWLGEVLNMPYVIILSQLLGVSQISRIIFWVHYKMKMQGLCSKITGQQTLNRKHRALLSLGPYEAPQVTTMSHPVCEVLGCTVRSHIRPGGETISTLAPFLYLFGVVDPFSSGSSHNWGKGYSVQKSTFFW